MSDAARKGPATGAAAAAFTAAPGGPVNDEIYRLLVTNVTDYAIYALDQHGNILTWNPGAERSKGYTQDEIIGRNFSIFFTPEDRAAGKPQRELDTAREVGRYEEENWRLRKDGTRFWANIVLTALRNDSGELLGYAKVTRDLTERRAMMEQLRESEERFRLLVTTVKDYAVFMLDPRGVVTTWNEGAERINGYSAEEIIGRHFSIFYPQSDVAAGKTERELEIAVREGKYEEEGIRVRKDGSEFWASVLITPINRDDGTLLGFAKITRDLTEPHAAAQRAIDDARRLGIEETRRLLAEQRAEELEALASELERQREAAQKANRAKGQFLATMSHELRTPLNAIGGYVDLLLAGVRGTLTESQISDLHRVRMSQRHLLGLINDLLNFTRVEAGRVNYDLTIFDAVDAVRTVTNMLQQQVVANELELELNSSKDIIRTCADPDRVRQILINLLTNAMKFTPPGGRITVDVSELKDAVEIAIADTGPGIPPENVDRIFEPFVQIEAGLTRTTEGVGLGLAISRDLARAMHGQLTVSSKVGVGSTFRLTLPHA
jgi:PAS domain S-box-containing protein